MIIAIDLDNTICTPVSKRDAIKEVKNCKLIRKDYPEKIKWYRDRGHVVFIYTHRDEHLRTETEKWLVRNHIEVDYLIMNKPKFDILIDNDLIVRKSL